ncbi:MAG: sugar transferase [Ectothiorhodospiraceae bacterium]|nr:sugar transferase [Ectothiorhodospiraceae bacterium]
MLKRVFDIFVSLFGLLIISPVLVVVAVCVVVSMGRPVLFRQNRPGINASPFSLNKIRSMKCAHGYDGELLADAERISVLGKLLRNSSLDELPSLWNVLIGDMSLVGPRPLLIEYLPLYTKEQYRRHEVKPGITGWAQVNGRNAITWEEKFNLDVWYVDNQSFWLDFKILLMTIKKVFVREGISHDDHATMPFFTGTNSTKNSIDHG